MKRNVIVCTRDLDYGIGNQVKYELNIFDMDQSIKKVIVIGPKKIEGYSNKVEFEIIPNYGNFFITKEPYFAFKCNQKILKIIKKEEIHLIYLHVPIFAKPYGIETIRKVHFLHKSIRNYPQKPILAAAQFFHFIFSYFDLRTIKHSSSVYFVGKKIMKDAQFFYPGYKQKFEYRPNQIDKNIFFKVSDEKRNNLKKEIGIDDNKINILFVGRLEPLKGIEVLIDTLTDLKIDNIRLIIVGEGYLKKRIFSYSFIKFIKRVDHVEMYKYYNIADIFVMPSYYETFSLSVFEADVCGCRILSRDVGEVKSILSKDSLFTSDKELKQKLTQLLLYFSGLQKSIVN